jgi:hypothetical protein
LPLAAKLPAGFDISVETGINILRNDEGSGYHVESINSISVDHAIVGKLSGYVEFFSSVSAERHAGWVGTVDVGLEFGVTENVQFDLGCNVGVTHAADDVNPFAGVTVRF